MSKAPRFIRDSASFVGLEKDIDAIEQISDDVLLLKFGLSSDAVGTINKALAAIGTVNPTRLVFSRATWVITSSSDWSLYKNVTFVLRPGVVINNGNSNVVFPENLEVFPGVTFVGTGRVSQKNKDQNPLATPPGGYVIAPNHTEGLRAGYSLTKGTNNIAWGTDALSAAKTVRSSIAIGNEALKNVVGSDSTASAYGTFMGQSDANLAIGDTALRDCTTGYENLAVGQLCMQRLTTGRWNIAVGTCSLILNQSGECNVAIGPYASVTFTGNNSLAIGFGVLENHNTGSNHAIGYVAMNASLTSARCTVFGAQAAELLKNGVEVTAMGQEVMRNAVNAEGTTAFGAYALGQITTGGCTNTTAIGRNALVALSSGDDNTAVGAGALSTASTVVNSFGIGTSCQVTGSNQGQLGNSNVTVYAYGAIQNRSDIRDKSHIRDTVLGLDFIRALRPVDFRWDMREDYRDDTNRPVPPILINPRPESLNYEAEKAIDEDNMETFRRDTKTWVDANKLANITHDGTKSRSRYHHGLIAQEVQKLIADGVVEDFGGFQDHSHKGGDDVLSIGYEELIGPLIKAVQQLSERVIQLESAQKE